MAQKPNSCQETILKELAQHSLAAEYVFQPDRPLRTKNEPADLVWACNGCVILMYMQAPGASGSTKKKPGLCQKQTKHNLSQAKKWMRTWKSGINLQGHNGFRTFCLTYDNKTHIIVISVVQCHDAVAVFHDQEADKMGVLCCVTLPQVAFELLAHAGGTVLDILILLDMMRHRWKASPVPEQDVLDMIKRYLQWHYSQVGLPLNGDDDRLQEAAYALLAARRKRSREGSDTETTEWVGMDKLSDPFNDIHVGEFLSLVKEIRSGMDTTRDAGFRKDAVLHGTARLALYDFQMFFAFGDTDEIRAGVRHALHQWHEGYQRGEWKYGPILLMNTESGLFQFRLGERTILSQTEQLLDEWATSPLWPVKKGS
jgi:hypothetical protein